MKSPQSMPVVLLEQPQNHAQCLTDLTAESVLFCPFFFFIVYAELHSATLAIIVILFACLLLVKWKTENSIKSI